MLAQRCQKGLLRLGTICIADLTGLSENSRWIEAIAPWNRLTQLSANIKQHALLCFGTLGILILYSLAQEELFAISGDGYSGYT